VITKRLIVIAAASSAARAQSGISEDISPACLETSVRDVLNQNTAPLQMPRYKGKDAGLLAVPIAQLPAHWLLGDLPAQMFHPATATI
jgi:hypothetical protein